MEKIKSKEDRKLHLIIIAMAIVIVLLGINGLRNSFLLRKNPVKVKAVVTKIYTTRQTDYYDYIFVVNNISYDGSEVYNNTLFVGDTIDIIYQKTNPKNNEPVNQ